MPTRPFLIHAVSARRRLAPEATLADQIVALLGWVAELVEAGVDAVHLREADLPARDLASLVRGASDRARGSRTKILVNDRADVALAAGADGVHLPGRGLPVAEARRLRPVWRIGRSIHAGDAMDAVQGADYVYLGTIFASRSKPLVEPVGVVALADAVAEAPCPVLAIGGLTPERVDSCLSAGAAGVAAIGLFLPAASEPGALGPRTAVEALRGR